MSYMEIQVSCLLDELFPANPHRRVFSQHYVKFKDQKLFFDFYIKELSTLVECQGRQHTQFVEHFHGEAENFHKQKMRDNLKIEYAQKNNLFLIRLYEHENITKELILNKINKAFDSEYHVCD